MTFLDAKLSSTVPGFRALVFHRKYPDVTTDYLKTHLDFFSTIKNSSNFCYILALYYLFSHEDLLRNHWSSKSVDNQQVPPKGFLNLFQFCMELLKPDAFQEHIDKWILTDDGEQTKKQHDIIEFLLKHFAHESSYGISDFFKISCSQNNFIHNDLIINLPLEPIQSSLTKFFSPITISTFPPLLIITLQRFDFNQRKAYFKAKTVLIPNHISIKDQPYELSGLIIYSGNIRSGHYRTISKIAGKYVEYNDSHFHPYVSALTRKQIQTHAYLLLYHQTSNRNTDETFLFNDDEYDLIDNDSLDNQLQIQEEEKLLDIHEKLQRHNWSGEALNQELQKYFEFELLPQKRTRKTMHMSTTSNIIPILSSSSSSSDIVSQSYSTYSDSISSDDDESSSSSSLSCSCNTNKSKQTVNQGEPTLLQTVQNGSNSPNKNKAPVKGGHHCQKCHFRTPYFFSNSKKIIFA